MYRWRSFLLASLFYVLSGHESGLASIDYRRWRHTLLTLLP